VTTASPNFGIRLADNYSEGVKVANRKPFEILVVDDEIADLELMCNALRKKGYKVIPASSYLAGINRCPEFKVLDLSRLVPVPEELVQAAIRVFPVPPPPVKPSSAPALPILAARFTYSPENAEPELVVDADACDRVLDMPPPQGTDSPEAVVTAGIPSKR
jgi:CheY-like chemotaxis protein